MSDVEVNYGKRVVVKSPEFDLGGAVHQVNKGKKTNLGFYRETVKLFFVLFGKIKVVIMENGKMAALEVDKGNSFAIRPGLIFQIEGVEDSIVVEYSSKGDSDSDYHLVSKGSAPEEQNLETLEGVNAQTFAELSEDDKPAPPKKKPRTRKKKARAKKE